MKKNKISSIFLCAVMIVTAFTVVRSACSEEPNPYMPIFETSQTPWQVDGQQTGIADLKIGDANNDGLNELIIAGGYKDNALGFSVAFIRIYKISEGINTLLSTIKWYHPGTPNGYRNFFSKMSISDIDLDGNNEIIGAGYAQYGPGRGTAFMNIYRIDYTNILTLSFESTWNDGYSQMKATDVEIRNIDGDSVPEILLATTGSNGGTSGKFSIKIFNFDGTNLIQRQVWEHPGMIGYDGSAIWAGNVDEDPNTELIYLTMYGTGGCDPLWMYITSIDPNFNLFNGRMIYYKWGCEVGPSDVVSGDVLGNDGIEEIFTASHTNAAQARFSRWKATTTSISYDDYYSINDNGHTYGLTVYDIDNDGVPEFLTTGNTRYGTPSDVEIYVLDGRNMNLLANFGNQNYVFNVISNVGDVDNDYKMEIALGGNAQNKIYTEIWEMPGPPVLKATIDIDPDTINLGDEGKWITCYIELPEGYDVRDIDASTILLEDSLSPILDPKYGFVKSEDSYITDHDEDGIPERMVKFERHVVEGMLSPGTYNLKVTGELTDGTEFEGYSDEIRVIEPP